MCDYFSPVSPSQRVFYPRKHKRQVQTLVVMMSEYQSYSKSPLKTVLCSCQNQDTLVIKGTDLPPQLSSQMQLGNVIGSSYKSKQVSKRQALSLVESTGYPSLPSNSKTHRAVRESPLHLCSCPLPSGILTKEFICTLENGDYGTN